MIAKPKNTPTRAPVSPRQKPSTRNKEDLAWQCPDRGDRADFSDALIDRHDHDVQNADQDDGNKHQLDEESHHINHIGDVGKRRELRPSVDFDATALLFFLSQAKRAPECFERLLPPAAGILILTAISLTSLSDIRRISLASSKLM